MDRCAPAHHAFTHADDAAAGPDAAAGRLCLLTMLTFQRAPLFADWRCAWAASAQLSAAAAWPRAELLCWVLMPDHWHGLLRLREEAGLAQTVRLAKQGAARTVNFARGRAGLVWAPGYRDRTLAREDDLRIAARYLVGGPLRAGLARRAGDYPYWDAAWLEPAVLGRP